MSVINQVLNQLEQRGAHNAMARSMDRTMVRAVPYSRRRLNIPLLALGLVLVAGIAVWQWMEARKPVASLAEGPQVVAVRAMQLQPAAVAIPAPVVPAASAVIAGEAQLAETIPPAARATDESSTIPLPSVPRQDLGQRATARPLALSAVEGSGQAASAKPLVPSTVEGSGQAASTKPLAPSIVEGSGQAASTGSGQALRDVKNSPAPTRAEKLAPKAEERPAAPRVRPAKPQPVQAAPQNPQAAAQPPVEVSPMKQVSPAQHADAEFRKAVALMQQGHIADAIAGYEAALRLDAGHDAARQALVALLLESKRGPDAERVLQDGPKNKPEHTGFAMLLARFQVERGAVELAVATLEKSLPYANGQADYLAFYAALLQRQKRHKEAIAYYQVALQLAPDNGVWLMGYGISLQALQRADDARDAFRRALESKTLPHELQAFVQQKLKEL